MYRTTLYKVDKHKILKSNSVILKLYNSDPLPVQVGCCLYSVYSESTNIRLDPNRGLVWSFLCRAGRCVILHYNGQHSLFTFDRMLNGPLRWLDTQANKIYTSHQVTKLQIAWSAWYIWSLSAEKEMVRRQADLYISVAKRPNYLNMSHVVNFLKTNSLWVPISMQN